MAASEKEPEPRRLAICSYQTALCVIPPTHSCQDIDRLRALYDKAHGKWPAHINLIYPFVAAESLAQAIELIRSKSDLDSGYGDIHLQLENSDYFSHPHSKNIYIAPSDEGGANRLRHLRKTILELFRQDDDTYYPHLTVGQSRSEDTMLCEYLLAKAKLLLPIEWRVEELVVLVRERTDEHSHAFGQMKIWGNIGLSRSTTFTVERPFNFCNKPQTEEEWSDEEDKRAVRTRTDHVDACKPSISQPGITYEFSTTAVTWVPILTSLPLTSKEHLPISLTISSYNVLFDSIYPPVRDRYALIVRTLLSESALADILVLQEVSDDFLSYLLGQDTFRSRYPFTSHGPPEQLGIGPLASLRNIILLSRWKFNWEWVPFARRHKGAVILTFETMGKCKDSAFLPLVVAGVHLTCGLADDSVVAKKTQLQTLLNHLSRNYAENPWIIAGDFNITTSAFTIDAALKKKAISVQTATTLSSLESMLSKAGLSDSWFVARTEMGENLRHDRHQMCFEDLYEGEQGATFDPNENPLAAESGGKEPNNRPQRYDRILVKGEDFLRATEFNMFGFPEGSGNKGNDVRAKDQDPEPLCGSDHWGIRAALRIGLEAGEGRLDEIGTRYAPPQLKRAPLSLSEASALKSCLIERSMFPTDEEVNKRKEIFTLVKSILQQSQPHRSNDTEEITRSIISIVVVPVGSYGLGVWSTSSDIDCLCVGSITTKIFFSLANQRLRKAADLGVRILRRVKANSGTMLELDFRGIKLDLQYCPATKIAERWPEAVQLPPSDPSFDLPILSLTKLKSFRDLDYLQRTIPDLATFRIAHRFIRTWAKQRGIYSSIFGYLGGIHITLMLSRICKLLFREGGALTAADIICTFFNHYANLDWKTQIVFDPFFYKQQPRYHRSAREPMVILGLHTPVVNVADTASVPSVRTLVGELKRADHLLSEVGITWPKLLGGTEKEVAMGDLTNGAYEFLKSYNSYIKISVHYWGMSLAKGSTFVGWLESRCVLLLVDINKKLLDIDARIWPARFTANHAKNEDEREYQGCYLVGLAKAENAEAQAMTESDRKLAQSALRTALDQFANRIRCDEKYFDAKSSWVDVAQVRRSELEDLALDDREWGNYRIEVDESDTEDEMEEAGFEFGGDNGDNEAAAPNPSAKAKALRAGKANPKPASIKKLRPATDVLNRLRWDPNLDSGDYIVGYEDRFLGTREMVIDRWKTEQTDEEFIPQHRILYFRRRTDGAVVWDRETRRDEVFGSGAGKAA